MDVDFRQYFGTHDISAAIEEMRAVGAALRPAVLRESFQEVLRREASTLPFKKAVEMVGVVRQEFDYYAVLGPIMGHENLELLRKGTEWLVRGAGITMWNAFELALNRYREHGGLETHRDFKRHPDVIAIWNIAGSCRFELLASREGPVTKVFEPNPGDLILLRGAPRGSEPGIRGDLRPFHRVTGIVKGAPRISATVRDNTKPNDMIEGFSYANL